jgi:hypothetical protein
MNSYENAITWVQDQIAQGKLDVSQANVEVVRIMGVRLIHARIPAQVRKDLNAAVALGRLGHLKKDGLCPEAYFHPNSRPRAIDERNACARSSIESIAKVLA